MELPPRTRRIPLNDFTHLLDDGTTSAHAENTRFHQPSGRFRGNYLRARGEYLRASLMIEAIGELPPRTRRIRFFQPCPALVGGTTSAHAENTYNDCDKLIGNRELPPRTRRIPVVRHAKPEWIGTTSAHAENTLNQLGLL